MLFVPWMDIKSMVLQNTNKFIIINFVLLGLVHVSQLAKARVEKPEDVVEEGESVWVKVIDISV